MTKATSCFISSAKCHVLLHSFLPKATLCFTHKKFTCANVKGVEAERGFWHFF
ncbi:hypothetical protein HMPREF9069_00050 [Atopobium sp. oral taxon 810 str. F0209]|nr:hypothetical protein HMPREF9069_00050 [Atopobium sp. oral taxon 810 str. F0209]